MSASSAAPPTPGGLVLPNVDRRSAAVTVTTVVAVRLQLPAASRARTVRVEVPSAQPETFSGVGVGVTDTELTVGRTLSMTSATDATGPQLPAPSLACTNTVCTPSAPPKPS